MIECLEVETLKLHLQDRNDFELITLPALVPVLSTASGDTLLLLVKHAELITNKVKLINVYALVNYGILTLRMFVSALSSSDWTQYDGIKKFCEKYCSL